jgi:hypothetical protein
MLFFGMGLAHAINAVLRTDFGYFADLAHLMNTVSQTLFRMDIEPAISASAAAIALLAYCAICLLLLLRKVRAYEVIR